MSFRRGKTFEASLEELRKLVQFVKKHAREVGLSEVSVGRVELAAEEAFVNIIQHGYATERGEVEVVCHHCDERGFEMTFCDKGIHFDPSDELNCDQSYDGYGIFLMQYLMDSIEYERKENMNFLTLCKRN